MATDDGDAQHSDKGLPISAKSSPFEMIDLPLTDFPEAVDIVASSRYEIIREIGRGGMGVVFLARDREIGAEVAVKFLLVEFADDEVATEALRAEARLSMSLAHPNIIRLHNIEISGRARFLVMEYVDGPSLADIIDKKGKLPLDQALPLVRDACAALDYAHSEGVVHLDIKPANFILTRKNVLKLGDFGVAQRMRQAFSTTSQKIIIGTPLYMSPEQLMGRGLDHRTDIYSLGAVIYELLAGLPPFTPEGIEVKIMLRDPQPIEGVPEHVSQAVVKALSKHPDHRWQTASDFYDALIHGMSEEKTPLETLQWPKPHEPAAGGKGRGYRVLAVDDEEDIRAVVKAVLTPLGYAVDTGVDGQDGLDRVAACHYDLIVLDVMMPRLNGIQMLSRLRKAGVNTPVLMLTALSDDKHVLESFRSGANYYMVKPFSKRKLVAAARYLMGDFTPEEEPLLAKLL
jgi:CheY-like chemotaxis protein